MYLDAKDRLWLDYGPKVIRYIFASNYVQAKIILDIACGSGYGSRILTDAGAKEVIGGDISQPAINYAKENYNAKGLHFVQLDVTRLPFSNNCFDVIVSFETIEHLQEWQQRQLLCDCRRCLKNEGTFLCSTPNRKFTTPHRGAHYHWSREHVKEFLPGEFQDLLSEYFTEVTLFGQGRTNLKGKIWHWHIDYFLGEYVSPKMPERTKRLIKRLLNNILWRNRSRFKPGWAIEPHEERLNQRYLLALCK